MDTSNVYMFPKDSTRTMNVYIFSNFVMVLWDMYFSSFGDIWWWAWASQSWWGDDEISWETGNSWAKMNYYIIYEDRLVSLHRSGLLMRWPARGVSGQFVGTSLTIRTWMNQLYKAAVNTKVFRAFCCWLNSFVTRRYSSWCLWFPVFAW